ncbi:hypothetical protein [Aquiflexum gelatinilyticum]|uniref:hypothetical protein n=1 Tax=Aquiflexum gelatinilyticum TaxID=2961943 RepID=UPI00216A771B|nr:hypothetical protein [Aquiflexum gelatinilyticum]MCS4436178.1 hypothetical protein [Aquiflexum gelatinilyticum]
MKNLEIKEIRLDDVKWIDGLTTPPSTYKCAHHLLDSEKLSPLVDPGSAYSLFSLINDGKWLGWIGLYPVLDPFGRLGISEIQFGFDPIKADCECILIAINFLLIKARSLGFWSCLIHLKENSELIPFLFNSGFKILGQKSTDTSTYTENGLLILEKRLN